MENREAIEILRGCVVSEERENGKPNGNITCDLTREVLNMAISALEKQVGKKPIEVKNVYPPGQFECPVCGCCVGRHKTLRKVNDLIGEVLTDCKVEFNFCPDCGQRIDWSDEHDTD